MNWFFRLTVGSAILASFVSAQKAELHRFEACTVPPHRAGTYHLATGTWTRAAGGTSSASLTSAGSEIVYNCTVPSGYLAALAPGETWTVSGRLPGTQSPEIVWNPVAIPVGSLPGSARGCQDSYHIDGFQISYCTRMLGPNVSASASFFQSYMPVCTAPVAGPPQGGPFTFNNLPGRTSAGPMACWTVDFDLTGTSSSFDMLADGDGVFSAGTDDAFAFQFTFPSTTSTANATSIRIAGAPADGTGPLHTGFGWREFGYGAVNLEAAGYDGTRFDGPFGAAAPVYPANGAVGLPTPGGEYGSDMVADDAVRIDGIAVPGCFFFGGPIGSGGAFDGPYANVHLELFADVVCGPLPAGTPYCAGDGLNPLFPTSCPCANFGQPGHGCASSFNPAGAALTTHGQVATDDVVLDGSGMNASGFCIFAKGSQDNSSGIVAGDGIRCASGTLLRLRSVMLAGGAASFPDSTFPASITLSSRSGTPVHSGLLASYYAYYRNASAAFCPPASYNTTNGYLIVW